MTRPASPEKIMQLGMAFLGSKTLLSAVELQVFTMLAKGRKDAHTLGKELGLHTRSALDFFDALVALGMLERQNNLYANTPETDFYLDQAKPSYIGGFLEMANRRLYRFWGSLTEGLKTGISMDTNRAIAQKFPWQNYHSLIDIGSAQGGLVVQVGTAHSHCDRGRVRPSGHRPDF